jgi:hypothetical protein
MNPTFMQAVHVGPETRRFRSGSWDVAKGQRNSPGKASQIVTGTRL